MFQVTGLKDRADTKSLLELMYSFSKTRGQLIASFPVEVLYPCVMVSDIPHFVSWGSFHHFLFYFLYYFYSFYSFFIFYYLFIYLSFSFSRCVYQGGPDNENELVACELALAHSDVDLQFAQISRDREHVQSLRNALVNAHTSRYALRYRSSAV